MAQFEMHLPTAEENKEMPATTLRVWKPEDAPQIRNEILARCGRRWLPPVRVRLSGLPEPVTGAELLASHVVATVWELGRPTKGQDRVGGQRVETRQPFAWSWLKELPELRHSFLLKPSMIRAPFLPYVEEKRLLANLAPPDADIGQLLLDALTPEAPLVGKVTASQYQSLLVKAADLHNAQMKKRPNHGPGSPGFPDTTYRNRTRAGLREFARAQRWAEETTRGAVALAATYDSTLFALAHEWLLDPLRAKLGTPPTDAELRLYRWINVRLLRLATGVTHGPGRWDPVLNSLFQSMSFVLQERMLCVAVRPGEYPPEWDEEVLTAVKGYLVIYREFLKAMRSHRRDKKRPARDLIAARQQRSQDQLMPDRCVTDAENLKELYEKALDELETEADQVRAENRRSVATSGKVRTAIYSAATVGRMALLNGADPTVHEQLAVKVVHRVLRRRKRALKFFDMRADGLDSKQTAERLGITPRAVNSRLRAAIRVVMDRLCDHPALRSIITGYIEEIGLGRVIRSLEDGRQ